MTDNPMMGVYLISMVIMGISWLVSKQLRDRFAKYSRTPLSNNMTGAEIAERMLADNGITNVKVVSVPGQLSDHYNPATRTVNLSQPVYGARNAAAAAVAAHECGHAVQHAKAYKWLTMRSNLVPAVSFASKYVQWILLAGVSLAHMLGPWLLMVGVILFAFTTLFSIVTLPVEYDASNRALAWMRSKNIVTPGEYTMSADALKWAARTYLVAAIGSIGTLVYYVTLLNRRN